MFIRAPSIVYRRDLHVKAQSVNYALHETFEGERGVAMYRGGYGAGGDCETLTGRLDRVYILKNDMQGGGGLSLQ